MGKLHGRVLIAVLETISYGFTEDGKEVRTEGAGFPPISFVIICIDISMLSMLHQVVVWTLILGGALLTI